MEYFSEEMKMHMQKKVDSLLALLKSQVKLITSTKEWLALVKKNPYFIEKFCGHEVMELIIWDKSTASTLAEIRRIERILKSDDHNFYVSSELPYEWLGTIKSEAGNIIDILKRWQP